jgi:glycosyltransferase involved in cell wall biosynthesis
VNIWIIAHYANPPDRPGSTRHYDFARALIKQGHKVTIFASSFHHRTRKDERLEAKQTYRRQTINDVNFIWIKASPYYGGNDRRRVINMLSYALRVIPLGVGIRERPDVIWASSPHPFAGLAGYILSRLKRVRFIFEVRDLWPEVFVQIGGYSSKSPVVRSLGVLEKFLYRQANIIIVLMPRASEYITGLGIPANKICYVPNGVNPELYANNSADLPRDLDIRLTDLRTSGKVLVGYTGAHGIHDSLDTIIEAAKSLQEKGIDIIHLLLVGDGAEKQRIVKKAESLGLNNITFFTFVPKNTMPGLLRALDIAIMCRKKSTLYQYGMSTLKLWDYMMCARPIVCALDSVNNPVADADCGITVPPEAPEKLANAIVQLCNLSDDERQAIGIRGREYVMKYHSTPVLANKVLDAIQSSTRGNK